MKTRNSIIRIVLRLALTSVAMTIISSGAAPADVDLSFDPGSGVDGTVLGIAVQPDGKIIIGGDFSTVRGLVRHRIARLNADGSGDGTFNPGTGADDEVRSIALQPDGKIVMGGRFTTVNGRCQHGIARLNPDGALDTTFNPGPGIEGTESFSTSVNAIAVQPDGRMLIGGTFASVSGTTRFNIARLNGDGSVDRSFNASVVGSYPSVASIVVQPNGKVLIGGIWEYVNDEGYPGIARLSADGSLDRTFYAIAVGRGAPIYSVALQPDGKMLIGGAFSMLIGDDYLSAGIARLNADGKADSSFYANNAFDGPVYALALQSDGKVLMAGTFTSINGTNHTGVARLNGEGGLDASLDPGSTGFYGLSLALQPDGKVLLANWLSRLNPDGRRDGSFMPETGVAHGSIHAVEPQRDGKVLVGGHFNLSTDGGVHPKEIIRLNEDGSVDAGFAANIGFAGLGGPSGWVKSVATQPDGKVVVGGLFTSANATCRTNLARLNLDGSLDDNFGTGTNFWGEVSAVTVQPDGKILVGGFFSYASAYRRSLARLNPDGTLDSSFNPRRSVLHPTHIQSVALQPDGKILIAGNENGFGNTNLTRLNVDGSLDTGFIGVTNDVWGGAVNSIAVQADGKVVIGGRFTMVNGVNRTNIARLNADGTVDDGFLPGQGPNYFLGSDRYGYVSALALQQDGKAVIAGRFNSVNGTNRNYLARLNANGSLDDTFDTNTGVNSGFDEPALYSVAIQPDGKVLIAGSFSSVNGVARQGIARLLGDNPLPFRPYIGRLIKSCNGAFQFTFTNTSAVNFTVFASTNLSMLSSSWSALCTPVSLGGGIYQFTDPDAANFPRRFYQLRAQ